MTSTTTNPDQDASPSQHMTHSDTPLQSTAQEQPNTRFTILPVRTPSDLTQITRLFTTYAQSLNLDLSFQDFQAEMASLPGKYSPSHGGELLLARSAPGSAEEGESLGCVALRSLPVSIPSSGPDSSTSTSITHKFCEMKRLYVSPSARGFGLGRALALEVISVAESLGYEEMRLDTLPSMVAAQGMYRELGFVDVEAYCFNPVDGVRFLGLRLPRIRGKDGQGEGR